MYGHYCIVKVVGNKEIARSKALPFTRAWQLAQKLNRRDEQSEYGNEEYHDVERAALVEGLPIITM